MRRRGVIFGALMIAVCGAAQVQARIETVVVTSSFAGPRAQKFLSTTWKRLTPDGQAFVQSEGKRVYDRATDIAAARTDAEENCAKAFKDCGNEDATALAVLVLDRALLDSLPDGKRLLSGIPPDQMRNTLEQVQACNHRNDRKCAKKVFRKALPADTREALDRIDEHLGEIRRNLKLTLAQAGFVQKDDR